MTIRPVSVTAALAATLLALTACTPDKTQVTPSEGPETTTSATENPSQGGGETQAPANPGEGAVYDQTIDWSQCDGLECATVQVPLDWSDPDGETVDLAINRISSAGSDVIGSVLINPGGPGGSGLDFTEYFASSAGTELLDHYDVVGFDPRGVGASSGIDCGPDEAIDEYYIPDYPLETEQDLTDWITRTEAFAQGCHDASGALVENVDTVSAARDMDLLRALLGDSELYYMGFSYGTQLGATYAELYPENVGRMTLDGAVDFLLPSEETSRGQAKGFELALTNYLTDCVDSGDCPLSGDVEQARAQLQDLIQTALTDPYPTGTEWDLNGNLIIYGVVVTLYDEASWAYLDIALNELIQSGTGAIMYELAGFYLDRNGSTGEYSANSTWAFTAIGCLDTPQGEPATLQELLDFRAEMEEASPTFGWWFGASPGCEGWPWTAAQHIESLDNAATAGPMLVVGTTNDPATPIEWSQSLVDRLGSEATLLTYDGEGHTAYGRSNQCVIDAVDGYMVDGVMPDSGTQC